VAAHECIDTHVFSFEDTRNVLERVILLVFLIEGMKQAWGDEGWLIIADTLIALHFDILHLAG